MKQLLIYLLCAFTLTIGQENNWTRNEINLDSVITTKKLVVGEWYKVNFMVKSDVNDIKIYRKGNSINIDQLTIKEVRPDYAMQNIMYGILTILSFILLQFIFYMRKETQE